MYRRDAIQALAALGALGPRIGVAQTSARTKTIGYLYLSRNPLLSVLGRTLNELGWDERKNIVAHHASAEGDPNRLAALAADLVNKEVDVIFASGPDPAVEAARASKIIPIVFWGPAFPIEQGLIDSYARPGRNITGVAWGNTFAKQLEFIKQLTPRAARVAHFRLPTAIRKVDGGTLEMALAEIESPGKRMGFEVKSFDVTKQEDFEDAFKAIKAWRAQALITYTAPTTVVARERIVRFANGGRIPGFFDWRGFVDSGGLFSYGPLTTEMTVQAARQIDRILRGARPADVPVELPARYEMVINGKTAAALDITIPQELLLRADEVIR